MLRLDLKDSYETVLFIDPMKGVRIKKEPSRVKYEVSIEAGNFIVCYAVYDSEKDRDAAYEYVLTKINEYLFPQIEPVELGPICPNDFAVTKE